MVLSELKLSRSVRFWKGTNSSGSSVRRLKGSTRQIVRDSDRMALLAALQDVAHVLSFSEDTPCSLLSRIRPNVLVKGGTTDVIVGREIVESYGGMVCRAQQIPDVSTTRLINAAILRIETTYEVRGMKEHITSYDNPAVGEGAAVNDCRFQYSDFGQLVTEYQSHDGLVDTDTTPKVQYAYADGSDNTIRMTKLIYPNGRELNYDYGTADGIDDASNRVASLVDDDGSTHLVDYSYLGQMIEQRSGVSSNLASPEGQNVWGLR